MDGNLPALMKVRQFRNDTMHGLTPLSSSENPSVSNAGRTIPWNLQPINMKMNRDPKKLHLSFEFTLWQWRQLFPSALGHNNLILKKTTQIKHIVIKHIPVKN
ncbi:MAG: hypothetical protein ABFR47_06655, partial [Verrucomicrobiota bacterium]